MRGRRKPPTFITQDTNYLPTVMIPGRYPPVCPPSPPWGPVLPHSLPATLREQRTQGCHTPNSSAFAWAGPGVLMALPNRFLTTGKRFLNLQKTPPLPAQVSRSISTDLDGGLLASLDMCREQGALEPRQEPGRRLAHLLPPLLDSHRQAERDHRRPLYEPGLEGDFPLTPHPSESAGARGEVSGERESPRAL